MSTVYIMGAGASHDIPFRISFLDGGYGTHAYRDFTVEGPLSSGYFYYFNQIQKTVKESVSLCPGVSAGDKLLAYICGKYSISKDDLFDKKEISQKVNIENLYIDIERSIEEIELTRGGEQNYLSLSQNTEFISLCFLQRDLKKYISETLSFIGYHCISKSHRIFANYVAEANANIISFNWDTLIDEAMYNTKLWNYNTGYGFAFDRVIYKNDKEMGGLTTPKTKSVILKPHGSINWYSDIHKEKLYLIVPVVLKLRGGTLGQLRTCESIDKDTYVFSYIIPPGKKRKQFPFIWEAMKDVLQSADKIIAIGFSFNSNDSHVKEEFERISFKKGVAVEIVNPAGLELFDIYRNVFKTENISIASASFSDYCDSLKLSERIAWVK